jgi:FkbM family methyltransferase
MWLTWQADTGYILGAYEPQVADALRGQIAPGDVCIDIGAHIGYYAILMARLTGVQGAVVAFEPVPRIFEMLQRNIALNVLRNVQLEPLAVSDHDGSLCLILEDDEGFPKTASVHGFGVGDRRKVVEVATGSLDTYLARTGKVPDLVLIDVEGAEFDVLRGAQATLQKARPKLLIEIHGWDSPESDEVSRFLSTIGYQRAVLGYGDHVAYTFFRPANLATETTALESRPDGSAVGV